MKVQISGKHVDLGEALRSRIDAELVASIGKYFVRGGDADVVVSRSGHSFRVDCAVRLASGHGLESHALGDDAHTAFGGALNKIEARIRRYKRRLKNHHHPSRPEEFAQITVLRAPEAFDDVADDDGWDESDDDLLDGHEPPKGMVIAETQAPLKTMTVSMAVMEMDLTECQAIVFRNAAHGGLAVVYRRPDGNIGWVDPERTNSPALVGSV
ncbi:MAG TPA: ribosome-associated translation inhibitor RaiA [Caulobacteraceae bacterium]|nr:ribosome-associated translation inhibitor RaiA [Caulobacteraceae bacterium]